MLSGCSDGCNLDGDQRPADPDDSHCLRSRHAPGTSSYVPHTARLDLSTGHFTVPREGQLGPSPCWKRLLS